MSAAFLLYLGLVPRSGLPAAASSAAPYALDLGVPALRNLLSYVGWTVDVVMLRPGLRFVDSPNPDLFPLAVAALLAMGVLAMWRPLRKQGWLVGLAAYFLLLATVVPLRNHAYRYYLYVPLMGSAFAIAGLIDALTSQREPAPQPARRKSPVTVPPRRPQRLAWTLAIAMVGLMTFNTARLTRLMEDRPSPVFPGLRADPIIDRGRIAQRAITSLRQAQIAPGTDLVFLMRERIALIARNSIRRQTCAPRCWMEWASAR
jgi:hypothetical protein